MTTRTRTTERTMREYEGILRRMRTRVNERSHNSQKKKRTQDKDAG